MRAEVAEALRARIRKQWPAALAWVTYDEACGWICRVEADPSTADQVVQGLAPSGWDLLRHSVSLVSFYWSGSRSAEPTPPPAPRPS